MARRPIATVEFPRPLGVEVGPGLARRVWRDHVVIPVPIRRGALEAWRHLREGEKVRLRHQSTAVYSVFAICTQPVPTNTSSETIALATFQVYVEGELVEETMLCPNCVAESVQRFPWEQP